ncbi:hypothetical protein FBU30_008371 [Linnemannia zychae]|nr:hypothetical protein FBU30_008371 [Linnemannia zychae]
MSVSDIKDILISKPSTVSSFGHESCQQVQPSSNGKTPITQRYLDALGYNQTNIKQFAYIGDNRTPWLLESVLKELGNLTKLELKVTYNPNSILGFKVDIDKFLDTFQHLTELSLRGRLTCTSGHETMKKTHGNEVDVIAQAQLKSFTFEPQLIHHAEGLNAFSFFRRLGNLRKITIKNSLNFRLILGTRPWDFGRALSQNCPKLESIETGGPVFLLFFDLPILSHDRIRGFIPLIKKCQSLRYRPSVTAEDATRNRECYLKRLLETQERDELLYEHNTLISFFPHLKELRLGQDHSLSGQDLILLGVKAPFLTHLVIETSLDRANVWDIYERTGLANRLKAELTTNASVSMEDNGHYNDFNSRALIETECFENAVRSPTKI